MSNRIIQIGKKKWLVKSEELEILEKLNITSLGEVRAFLIGKYSDDKSVIKYVKEMLSAEKD